MNINSRDRLPKLYGNKTKNLEAIITSMISQLIASKSERAFYGNMLQIFSYSFLSEDANRPDFDMGLEIEKDKLRIVINPGVFFAKDTTEQEARFVHELEHVLRNDILFSEKRNPGYQQMVASYHEYIDTDGHPQRYKKITPLASLAMDLAINSLKFKQDGSGSDNTEFLLREGIFPTQHPFETYPPYQTWEWYYEQMVDDAKKGRNGFNYVDGEIVSDKLDPNSFNNSWNLSDSDGKELSNLDMENIENFINSSIERAISETQRSAGKVPGRYQKYIDELKKIPYNWREQLDTFVASGLSPEVRSSKRKISRRARGLGCIARGTTYKPDANIWVFIDTSGSISQEQFENAVSHVNKIRKVTKAVVWISTFDAQVKQTVVLDNINYSQVLKTKIAHTRGGTAFKPIFERILEERYRPDVVIIFTDGECYDTPEEIKGLRLLWVYTPVHRKQAFGKHLIMKEYF